MKTLRRREQLAKISRAPLEFCPQFPEIAARWEDWWNFRAKRPLIVAAAGKPGAENIYWGKAFHLLDDAERWLATQHEQMEHTICVGEMLPRVRVDIGPEAPAAFLGAPLTLSESEQTAWNTPTIDSWSPPPSFAFDAANEWFHRVVTLSKYAAADACGRYLICLPDMGGAIDVLVNMRDPNLLCMDIMDEVRETVKDCALQVARAWEGMYGGIIDTILEKDAGFINQMNPWSNVPYVVPTCDFMALISPDDFIDCCIPSLQEQAKYTDRICFHLDGPQAARHAETLGRQDWIHTVQYTLGSGTPSALAKTDMFLGLQRTGKPLLVFAPPEEIPELTKVLDPHGLAICADRPLSISEAEEMRLYIATLDKNAVAG